MPHPVEGTLRRLLDEPVAVAAADREHVAACATCSVQLEDARTDAGTAAAVLAEPAGTVDVDAAWQRLQAAGPAAGAAAPVVPLADRTSRRTRVRRALARPAAAGLAVVVVLAGASTAAANDWLQVFRAEQVAPLSLTAQDLVGLPDLSGYGELQVTAQPSLRAVEDVAAAEAATGLVVPEVAQLPRGVEGDPVLQVGDPVEATFTFSSDLAAASAGRDLPPPPPGVEGSALRLTAGPGVASVWPSRSGAPALLVARAVAPEAFSTGAPFEVVRDHLLSLPGVPDELAAQLRAFAGDGETLPLPVPEDRVDTRTAVVDGAAATVLTTKDRALAAVAWVQDDVVTVVAGSLDDREVLELARGLR